MKFFGNIVTPYKKAKYDFPLKVCASMDSIDPSLPTLVVGLEQARQSIPSFSILRKHYPDQNVWWTYMRTERGNEYEEDLDKFYQILLEEAVKGAEYRFIDLVKLGYEGAKRLIRYMNGPALKKWYNDRGVFLFVYDVKRKVTYGLSLSTCRYCGINTDKLLYKLERNPRNFKVWNFKAIPYGIRKRFGDNLDKYFPLLEYF